MSRRYSGVRVFTIPNSPDQIGWILIPVAFLLGGLAGHLFAGLKSVQVEGVLSTIGTSVVGTDDSIRQALGQLWQILRVLLLAAILSFSALGVIGLPVLMAVRGFLTAYAISALVRTWGYKGLTAAAIWIGGSDLILLTLLLLIAVPGWVCAWDICSGGRAGRLLPRNYMLSCAGVCLAGVLLAVFYQWLVYRFAAPLISVIQ